MVKVKPFMPWQIIVKMNFNHINSMSWVIQEDKYTQAINNSTPR